MIVLLPIVPGSQQARDFVLSVRFHSVASAPQTGSPEVTTSAERSQRSGETEIRNGCGQVLGLTEPEASANSFRPHDSFSQLSPL